MSSKPRILLLVHRVPFPPDRGDRIRSYQILKFLGQRARVSLGTLADEPVSNATLQELQRHCERVAIAPLTRSRWLRATGGFLCGRSATEGLFKSASLRQQLQRWTDATSYDAVFVYCSSMVQYLDLPGLQGVPTVVDLVDVDSQKFFDFSKQSGLAKRSLYCIEGRRLRKVESTLPRRAHAISLVTEAEADIYRAFCPNDRTIAIQNGVDLDYFRPSSVPNKPHSCVFVGAMDYFPNVDGVAWFCKDVWPNVLASCPEASFEIVGRNASPVVKALQSHRGVKVVGTVPDVRPYVETAACVVAPLRIARGVQNKVLEAMAMGKAVVASPESLDGIDAIPGQDVIRASSAEQWAAELVRLFAEPDARRVLGQNARHHVEERHAWSATLRPLGRLLDELLGAPQAGAPVDVAHGRQHPAVL